MRDDAIALRVLENIRDKIDDLGLEVLKVESDMDYFIDNIEDGDFLFILDATSIGNDIGEVNIFNIKDLLADKALDINTQHGLNFINMLQLYDKNCEGYLITIKVLDLNFGLGLSKELENRLGYICDEVFYLIENTLKSGEG